MHYKIKLILIVIIIMLGMSSCSIYDNHSEPEEIIIGEYLPFSTFDPLGSIEGQGILHYYKMSYETLIDFENGKPVPCLAESWENKGNTWIFHLRQGVKFTDGAEFTAETVKLNYETLQNNMSDMISYYGAVSRISEIKIIDNHTVSFTYDFPYYAVLEELSASIFGILSPKLFEDGNVPYGNVTETFGTGPYSIYDDNYSEGMWYTYIRNNNYWGENNGPEKFTVKIIPDADARLMALKSKEIDLLYGANQLNYDMYYYLSKQNGIKTVSSEGTYSTRNLLLNTNRPYLSDLSVRKAIQHGTDKRQITEKILYDMEYPADILFPITTPYCDVAQNPYKYDMDASVGLLEEAGWSTIDKDGYRIKNGQRLVLEAIFMKERTVDEQILKTFQDQMNKIGIKVNISSYETNTWYEIGFSGEFDVSINDTYGFPQDPQVFIAAMQDYGIDYPAQQGLRQKPEIDRNIGVILTTSDEEVIRNAYAYVLTTLHEEAVNLPISRTHNIAAYNTGKIETINFSDDPSLCDVKKIVVKNRGENNDK